MQVPSRPMGATQGPSLGAVRVTGLRVCEGGQLLGGPARLKSGWETQALTGAFRPDSYHHGPCELSLCMGCRSGIRLKGRFEKRG
jgi:hypothetical protein